MKAKGLMIQATASDSGKSTLVTVLCRHYANQGLRVFPFKSQNMALNAAYIADGKEMSKAQLIQAEAARRQADIRMNPIFLKAQSDHSSEVIFMGESLGKFSAKDYQHLKRELKLKLKAIYKEIESENDLIIMEGAGSAAEINLREDDLVNMGMADLADVPVLLIADIDLGGVFASLYGTIMLQEEAHRKRIKGIIINKFRGDLSILQDGLDRIEDLTGVPVLGVLPYMDIPFEEEDSMALAHMPTQKDWLKDIDLAVIAWPGLRNFSSLESLKTQEDLSLRLVHHADQFAQPDLVILPDTNRCQEALFWLKEQALDDYIKIAYQEGAHLFGLGTGYYLLGQKLQMLEGQSFSGLGFLNVKAVERDTPLIEESQGQQILSTFEIVGEERAKRKVQGSENLQAFDSLDQVRATLNQIRIEKGLEPLEAPRQTYAQVKDANYDRVAEAITEHIDMEALEQIIFGQKGE